MTMGMKSGEKVISTWAYYMYNYASVDPLTQIMYGMSILIIPLVFISGVGSGGPGGPGPPKL